MRRYAALVLIIALTSVAVDAAREFGAVASDRIETGLTTHSNAGRSYLMWFYRTGNGGGGFGRLFDKNANELLQYDSSVNSIAYNRVWSASTGRWRFTAPPANEWHSIIVTYNGSAATNNALMYLDGVQQTTNSPTVPSGTISDNTSIFVLGNRTTQDRAWDGRLAEFAVWNRILTSAEITALGDCTDTASAYPSGRVSYIAIFGTANPEPDEDNTTDATVFGTTSVAHPPACSGTAPPSLPCSLAMSGVGQCL